MVEKQRRDVVENIIKNLLDLEIPDIQAMVKTLADQIKKLEERSLKLQKYVAEIEHLATEEASALVESRISEILKDLDVALSELKKRSKKAQVAGTEISAPPKKAAVTEKAEREELEVEEPEAENIVPRPKLKPQQYSTPEGYVVRKSRR